MKTFPIPKMSGTHADVLAAIGLADLLGAAGAKPVISDKGSEFQIDVPEPVSVELLRRLGLDAGYDYLLPSAKEKAKVPKAVTRIFNYPEEKQKRQVWLEAQKAAKGNPELAEQAATRAPRDDFAYYMILNILQGDGPLNKSVVWIQQRDPEQWPLQLMNALSCVAQRKPPELEMQSELVQLFNPQAAKGYARLKPDTTSRNDSTKDAWGNPLLEWLRFRGFFQGTLPVLAGDDIRLYCLEPKKITLQRLQTVLGILRRDRIYGAAAKIDCLGVLAIAQALVVSWADFPDEWGESPNDLLSAVMITHYKSLGQAKAVTGLTRLAIPNWFELRDESDVRLWTDTLAEYQTRLRRLDDSISDEMQLLLLFRCYLENRGPETLYRLAEFHEAFGIYVIRKRGQDDWRFTQFSEGIVEKILTSEKPYSEIIQNAGFQAIARALRSATVSAQAQKRNKTDGREIRYDILPELRRKRMLPEPDEFLDAVSEFVASYNTESAKRLEQGKNTGTIRISEEDYAAFVGLLQPKESPTVLGALLCAYATCKASADTVKGKVIVDTDIEEGGE